MARAAGVAAAAGVAVAVAVAVAVRVAVVVAAGVGVGVLAGCGGGGGGGGGGGHTSGHTRGATSAASTGTLTGPGPGASTTTRTAASTRGGAGSGAIARRRSGPPFGVALRVLTLIDHSRTIRLPTGAVRPRTLVTLLRYPVHARCPCPLVVFGHGFAVTPASYASLLRAWARAGYVVASPVFPLENEHAPGGPNEADLINQPRDMSFVITRLAARYRRLVDARQVAVAGQSDGGETALAVAYDVHFLDRRVRAAVILSGAKIPGVGGFSFPRPAPPLLATQGTADPINPPGFTHEFFDSAPPPKFLLELLGAGHLPPYTRQQPELRIVARVVIAFLDRYLKRERGALQRMTSAGDVHGVSMLIANR
jgi:dienelactone hydrolase